MACTNCGRAEVVLRGLCRPCYTRLRTTGKIAVTPRSKDKRLCSMEGCNEIHVARGLCEAHYRISKRYGDVISPFGYGERGKHPNYGAWTYQVRVKEGRVSSWDDFWQFVSDVGDRPSERHVARRFDETKPWGPDNFRWKKRLPAGLEEKEYQRIWRASHPLRYKNIDLRRNYGITLEQYAAMYEEQDGNCAICGRRGAPYDRDRGRSETLVVDHCHTSKKRRALLCPDCNKGLGAFKDLPERLRAAAAYLEKHR